MMKRGRENSLPNGSNISTNIISLCLNMIPSRLRRPSLILQTHIARQKLVDALIETGVIDM